MATAAVAAAEQLSIGVAIMVAAELVADTPEEMVDTVHRGGAGGTSYINSSSTDTSSVSGYNSGNGYASITFTGSVSRSFVYRGIIQNFVVPTTGTYKITADGGSGGTCGYNVQGNGAHIEGEFLLTKGQTINLIVGGLGGSVTATSGSGGGGRWRWIICI